MEHHGERMWEDRDGLAMHMGRMGISLREGLNMAYHSMEEAEIVSNWVMDGAGGYVQRPMYLKEPVRLAPTMLSEVNSLVPTIWRVGSVVREEDI